MEISAISAVSPKEIDWRRLTAKEIIKYENEGVEVPDEYLQWAKDFQNALQAGDNDDTTYETAAAASANTTAQPQSEEASEGSEEQESEKLTAEQRRDKMLESGESYYKVARTFSSESKVKAAESVIADAILNETGSNSDSKVESLESSISALLEEADELKSQIESLKNKNSKDNKLDNAAKIIQLQRQLKQLGASGQAMTAGTDADLNEYNSVIDSQRSIGADAVDTGNVTVEMGEKLKKSSWISLFIIGKKIIKNGKKSIEKGDMAQQTAQEVSSINSQNISQVSKKQNEIFAKTGAAAVSFDEGDAKSKDAKNDGEESSKAQTEEKSGENQQAAIASGNIDEIMKYKIRKGEDVNSESS